MLAAETTAKIEPLVPVLLAALAYAGLWVLVAVAAFVARRPVQPDEGPATQELGPESPAVANFLAGTFEVSSEAAPATLLDLAARRLFELETQPDGSTLVRVPARAAGRSELNAYERRVYDLVMGKAVDGVVPATALTTGTAGAAAKGWWKGFRKDVIADARARGQCLPVWGKGISTVLAVAALVPWFLVWASGRFNDPEQVETTPLALVVIGVALLLTFGGVRIASSDRQRGTDAGMKAGSRWLGVRAYLGETVTFPDLPPAHVLLWDRYLAYAAAFGVARECIRALPMGAELDRLAWSSYGGKWRQVKVRYGRVSRPGWGMSPPIAILRGVFFGALTGGVAYVLFAKVDPLDLINDSESANRFTGWGALAASIGFTLFAIRCVYLLVEGLNDAFVTTTVEGEVLRERTRGRDEKVVHWVAVDTGTLQRVHAWRVTPARAAEIRQHQLVRARVTPMLGFVRSFEPLPVISS